MNELQELKEEMAEISRELRKLWREEKIDYARIDYLEDKLTILSYRYAMKRDAMEMENDTEPSMPPVKQEKKKVFAFRRLRVALLGA